MPLRYMVNFYALRTYLRRELNESPHGLSMDYVSQHGKNFSNLLQIIIKKEKNSKEDSEKAEVMDWLFEVEGINVTEGVKNCGGAKAFLDTLKTFYYTVDQKAEEIENAFQKEDYDFYTIKVHALKSSAKIIGASKLSELSAKMEDAGKTGNVEEIKENTGELLTLYRQYKEKLNKLSEGESDRNREKCDEATIKEAYEALKESAPDMDYDSFEMVLLDIREYDCGEEHNDRFERLYRKMKDLDWDAIVEILNKFRVAKREQ